MIVSCKGMAVALRFRKGGGVRKGWVVALMDLVIWGIVLVIV